MSLSTKKLLILDRDGTLVLEPSDYQLDSFEKLVFYPEVFQYLAKIAQSGAFELIMITNQDGLGTDTFPEETFWPVHEFILKSFAHEGIHFKDILIDRSYPHQKLPTRKPGTGLLKNYMTAEYDLSNSVVIGDRLTDMELAQNLGAKGIWICSDPTLGAGELSGNQSTLQSTIRLKTRHWKDIFEYLIFPRRRASITRTTRETDIKIHLNLDGSGKAEIQTGIGFFDHMLEQIARHAACDLDILVEGDLHIDAHHTIEDTALALGEAFFNALSDKRGLYRYGFTLPMDDSLATVAVDFGGRPWLVWDASFQREKIGAMPTEMFFHFFKSFSDTAKCNLNIKAEGTNEHHKIEAIFKAFARAVKMAIQKDNTSLQLPTTKGIL